MPIAWAIDDGIREVLKWVDAAHFICWCAHPWKPDQQLYDAFKLFQETGGQFCPTFLLVKARCFKKV
jgi:hypothetical protein